MHSRESPDFILIIVQHWIHVLVPISQMFYKLIIKILGRIFFTLTFDSNVPIRSQFSTCHDSYAVVPCAKLWPVWMNIFHVRAFSIYTRFGLWAHKPFVKWVLVPSPHYSHRLELEPRRRGLPSRDIRYSTWTRRSSPFRSVWPGEHHPGRNHTTSRGAQGARATAVQWQNHLQWGEEKLLKRQTGDSQNKGVEGGRRSRGSYGV